MAVTQYIPNHLFYRLANGGVNFSSDTVKAILLDSTYTVDIDADATLSDITSHQLATNYGYTQNSKTLTGVTVTEDDTNNQVSILYESPTWSASGGDIGPFKAMALYSDTSSDDTIMGIADFGTNLTIPNGTSFSPQNLKFTISQA